MAGASAWVGALVPAGAMDLAGVWAEAGVAAWDAAEVLAGGHTAGVLTLPGEWRHGVGTAVTVPTGLTAKPTG